MTIVHTENCIPSTDQVRNRMLFGQQVRPVWEDNPATLSISGVTHEDLHLELDVDVASITSGISEDESSERVQSSSSLPQNAGLAPLKRHLLEGLEDMSVENENVDGDDDELEVDSIVLAKQRFYRGSSSNGRAFVGRLSQVKADLEHDENDSDEYHSGPPVEYIISLKDSSVSLWQQRRTWFLNEEDPPPASLLHQEFVFPRTSSILHD